MNKSNGLVVKENSSEEEEDNFGYFKREKNNGAKVDILTLRSRRVQIKAT